MKNKTILKTILSTLGIFSVMVPFTLSLINQVNYYQKKLTKVQTDTDSISNKVLSDDIQDVNQATQNGFIGKTSSTIFTSNFYGELLWSYDLNTSKFLLNSDNTQKNVTNFIVKYNENNNTVAVVGSYRTNNNSSESFFFQLHADTGIPYFSNEGPSLTEQQKYNESIITSEANPDLIKNPSSIIFNGEYATIFNENVLNQSENNKPSQINVLTLDIVKLTFDQSFFVGIKTDYTSDVFLGASFLGDGNILVTTGNIDSATSKLAYVRVFVLTSTLKSIMVADNKGGTTPSRLSLVDPNSSFLPTKKYSSSEVIRDILITSTNNNTSTVTYIFTGEKSVFRSFSYDRTTNILTTTNTKYLENEQMSSISYLTEDQVNKKIYFTTTTSGKELMSYDIVSNTFQNLSSDSKFSGAKVASFLPTANSSQLIIDKTDGDNQEVFGFQTNIGGNQQGEVAITIPKIEDYTKVAKENGLYNKLPSDITADDASKVLKISNYANTDYTVSLGSNNLISNNDTGTISFDLNLSITKWWDKVHSGQFQSTRNIVLTDLPTISSQRFQLVTNSSIDTEKYSKVYEFQQNIYLSKLTKKDILDYFISYGNKLSFNEDDISLNDSNSTAQIKATTNNDTGVLTIDYTIAANQDKTSLNQEYKSGQKTWQFNKRLDNYKQLQLNNVLIGNFKSSKYAGDISLDDLVSSIDFAVSGTGYSTDIKNWKWISKYSVGSLDWIKQQLNGELSGTLQYIRSENDPSAEEVPDKNFTLEINESGFRKLSDYIFGEQQSPGNYDNPIVFNQTLADSLTVTSNKQETIENLKEIITQTVSATNSWVPSDQIDYSVNEFKSTNTQLLINISISKTAKTNISLGTNSNIVLDNNWVQALTSVSPSLFNNHEITLNISIATFSWNVAKANTNNNITIDDINSSQMNTYRKKLPSSFVNDMSSSPSKFQKITNLLNQSNDLNYRMQTPIKTTDSSNDVGDFIIQSIQLTPNDETGTITANYTLVYPNLNNVSKVASITISGFLSIWDIIIFWIIIVVVVAIICVTIWLVFSYIKKNHKKKRIWSTHNFVKNFKKIKN
ncbi:MAG: hypothetical protein K2I67_00115 [Malacoplasma sp.]|nr:hypothetical protein [Malacoplasma sp.]